MSLLTWLATAPPALAEDEGERSDESDEEVVITGSRTETSRKDSVVSTQVINRSDITEPGASTVAELLEAQPGISRQRSYSAVAGQSFESITSAPGGDWTEYEPDLMDSWYIYDPSTHTLTPKNQVYVLQDADGGHWKMQITTYYEDGVISGDEDWSELTSGYPTFRWTMISE